jgi:hypothetical protein
MSRHFDFYKFYLSTLTKLRKEKSNFNKLNGN